ncbi:MAG: colicin E5-related ribonuclease, partial [Dehalococcoidia bacterium]
VRGLLNTVTYNGDGLRTSRGSGGTTTTFVWDIAGGLPRLLDDGTQYVLGIGLVAHVTASGTFYFLTDGLGSTMAEVDSSGTVVQSYTYDAFGAVKSSTGAQSTEFQFAGQQTDPSGLQYLRARYYDASTGRFLSRDPWAAAVADPALQHPYVYADNGPTANVDPSGRDCVAADGFSGGEEGGDCAGGGGGDGDPTGGYGSVAASGTNGGADGSSSTIDVGPGGASRSDPATSDGDTGTSSSAGDVPITIDAKIAAQEGARGWTQAEIQTTIDHPVQTSHTRFDGTPLTDRTDGDAPATAYVNADGSYIIRNDRTGNIVQISDKTDANWKAEWGPDP